MLSSSIIEQKGKLFSYPEDNIEMNGAEHDDKQKKKL